MKPVSTKVGNRRLLRLAKFLRGLRRDQFNFDYWVTSFDHARKCGTTCCAIGVDAAGGVRMSGGEYIGAAGHRSSDSRDLARPKGPRPTTSQDGPAIRPREEPLPVKPGDFVRPTGSKSKPYKVLDVIHTMVVERDEEQLIVPATSPHWEKAS